LQSTHYGNTSLSSSDIAERLRALVEDIRVTAPTRRFSASGLADNLETSVAAITPPLAALIIDRLVEPVTESRCALCGQQPEHRVEVIDQTLECPDHGEQSAQHYQLFQFTRAYRNEPRESEEPQKKVSRCRAPLRKVFMALMRGIFKTALKRAGSAMRSPVFTLRSEPGKRGRRPKDPLRNELHELPSLP